jgi:hypothetical protein
MLDTSSYKAFIEDNLSIVGKDGKEKPFTLNDAQADFVKSISGRDIILKARQLGFSSLILAIATTKFLLSQNERIVCISHETDATQRLLDRVKYYISTFERNLTKQLGQVMKIPMKYNSRNEMFYEGKNNSFFIGTSGAKDFGRGDTITFLHLSEYAFYDDPQSLMLGALQAVTPKGLAFIETTANGFNYFKDLWERSERKETGFEGHFYGPEWEYGHEFLEAKKKELGEKYLQEYPSNATEAFITSGNMFFDKMALRWYYEQCKDPVITNLLYV